MLCCSVGKFCLSLVFVYVPYRFVYDRLWEKMHEEFLPPLFMKNVTCLAKLFNLRTDLTESDQNYLYIFTRNYQHC